MIDLGWMQRRATELNEFYNYEGAKFSRQWLKKVLKRNKMSLRASQNTRNDSVAESIPKILKWHQTLRTKIQSAI